MCWTLAVVARVGVKTLGLCLTRVSFHSHVSNLWQVWWTLWTETSARLQSETLKKTTFVTGGAWLSHNSFLWLSTLKHEFPKSTWRRVLVLVIVSLMLCAWTSYLRRRHLFHCFGQTVQLVRGILLDSAGLPMLQMAYLTVNDSENDNMPPNREEVISFC